MNDRLPALLERLDHVDLGSWHDLKIVREVRQEIILLNIFQQSVYPIQTCDP